MLDLPLRPHRLPMEARRHMRSRQRELLRRAPPQSSSNSWGDQLDTKLSGHSRIAFLNLRGIPIAPNHPKHLQILETISHYSIDYLGLQEINLNLKVLPPSASWKQRFRHHHQTHTIAATNTNTTLQSRRIYGGVASFSSRNFTHRILDSGIDPTNLGRWTWTLFRGKQGITFRIICGYRPCRDYSDNAGTVYSQHEQYLHEQNDLRDPRHAFFEDLDTAILPWIAQGDIIILGLDANEFVRQGLPAFYADKWGLVDAHAQQHPTLPLAATHDTNLKNEPVDGLWISPGIHCHRVGMTGFGEIDISDADHRLLWINVPDTYLYGFPALVTIPSTTH